MLFDIETLSLEDLAGQVICPDIYPHDDPNEVEEMIKKNKPGGLFMIGMTKELQQKLLWVKFLQWEKVLWN